MAQIKPEYEALDEFSVLAAKIVDKYPNIFSGISVDGTSQSLAYPFESA